MPRATTAASLLAGTVDAGLIDVKHAIVVALAASALSCHRESRPSTPTSAPQDMVAEVQAAQRRMHVRYLAAGSMVNSIALADLEGTRRHARALSEIEEPTVLARWRPYFDAIQDAARDVERASTSMAAARSAAILGMRCAHCHIEIRARVTFPASPRANDEAERAGKMLGHHRAAVQMWEGIVGPDTAGWIAGAQALKTVPFTLVRRAATPIFADDLDDIARIRLYGERGPGATSESERADLYGDLLATCAHCHASLRSR